ncbi:MAG TPA: recombination protein O N-terminal domain-containing protein [Sphingorhabdus sp.]|jgi:DNA repair protein RecO (recombination protein O)|nr:recombination protein O N-terminal domain-containing protein [Sphingorhabdus sp.]
MQVTAQAIICSVRNHGETGAIVRGFTAEHGLLAGYVQGARGRHLRPVLIPGNVVKGDWTVRIAGQLAKLTVEPEHSRAHLLSEPLATSAIEWVSALTAATLPEAHPYPRLHSALDGLLSAIELAPAARIWAGAVAQYETLLLGELGYAEEIEASGAPVAIMGKNRERLVAHILGERRADVMAARERLVDRLKRAVA